LGGLASDLDTLEACEWLSDCIINANQLMLQKQFRDVAGLQDTQLLRDAFQHNLVCARVENQDGSMSAAGQMHFQYNHWTASYAPEEKKAGENEVRTPLHRI
jgi:hypothetical protein